MSRGRREVLMSRMTLWVLGSITIRLFDFSLLTKMSPVSLAAAGATVTRMARITAEPAGTAASLSARRSINTGFLSACELRRLLPAYARSKRWGKPTAGRRSDATRLSRQSAKSRQSANKGHTRGSMPVNDVKDPPALLLDQVVKSYGPVKAL